jgi:hypothetical protein
MIYGRPRPAVGTSGLVELHDQAITVSLPGICSEAASVARTMPTYRRKPRSLPCVPLLKGWEQTSD